MANERPTEKPEIAFQGPFGGIQSECSLVAIGTDGFADVENMTFNIGKMGPRFGVRYLPNPDATQITGIFDFFNAVGTRLTGVWSASRMWSWDYTIGVWREITGTTWTFSFNRVNWSVVGGKLLFSQGINPVQVWDGITTTFTTVSPNAVPGFHLGELNNHLIVCPTLEAGIFAPQRLRYTGAGDPSDWTSFNSGQVDLFNDLGPIKGWKKIYQQGYIFQQWGIVQQIITGNGLVPFDFLPLSSRSKGLYYSNSLSGSGEFAIYVGKDNVYLFNGTSSEPIGDMPLTGRSRIGARTRIMADLFVVPVADSVTGHITTSSNGRAYEAYWLLIPGVSTWIFNMIERNWTRYTWGSDFIPTIIGEFYNSHRIQIQELIGSISNQFWTFEQMLNQVSTVDSVGIGFEDGNFGLFDNVIMGDQPWSFTTGTLAFNDTRHGKDVLAVRLVVQAQEDILFTIVATNEDGQTQSQDVFIAANPGGTTKQVVPFRLPGFFMTFVFSGPRSQRISFIEIAFRFTTGAEAMTK